MAEMDDKQMADTLKYAISELNAALKEAAQHGLRVELEVRSYLKSDTPVDFPQISGRISRDL